MTRLFGAALLTAGASLAGFAQVQPGPVPEEAAGPAGVASPAGNARAADAEPAPVAPAVPIDPSTPLDPAPLDPTSPVNPPAPIIDPAAPPSAATIDPEMAEPGTRPPADLVPDDLQPATGAARARPIPEADGLGAPLPTDPIPPPAERAFPTDPDLSEPLDPIDPAIPAPPDAVPRDYDPSIPPTRPPVPPQPAVERQRPLIPLDDVVKNPVRVYEARRLVMMGHWPSSLDATDTLLERFPTDARVPYLRYYLYARSGQRDLALDALRDAVALERLYPILDYDRFMEPMQGLDRFYVERVRRAAAELDSAEALAETDPATAIPAVEDPGSLPARPARPTAQPPRPRQVDPVPPPRRPLPQDLPQDVEPGVPGEPLPQEPLPQEPLPREPLPPENGADSPFQPRGAVD